MIRRIAARWRGGDWEKNETADWVSPAGRCIRMEVELIAYERRRQRAKPNKPEPIKKPLTGSGISEKPSRKEVIVALPD